MTHLAKFALLGTVALLAAVGCQREPAVDNPNFNSENNSVTTQLVLNISTQTSQDQQTKQDPGVAQTGTSAAFRGIKDAFLLPVIQETNGQILPADMNAASVIDLSDVLNSSGTLPAHSSRIMEVQLPLKTNTLLFYAKAPMGTTAGYDMESDYKGMNIYDIYGKLDNYNIGKNKGSANFRLGIRMANTPTDLTLVDRFNAVETVFSSIMTILMNFGLNSDNVTHEALSVANYGYEFKAEPGVFNKAGTGPYSYPEIRWKDYVNSTGTSPVETDHALYSLESKLATLYTQMTTIHGTQGELRAASGEANLRMIQDLWTVINEIRCATPASEAEAVAKYFATKLDARLGAFLNTTKHENDGSAIEGVSYKETSTMLTLLAIDVDKWWPVEDATTASPDHTTSNPGSAGITALNSLIGTDNTILTNFPHNFNLPRGATHVIYDEDHLIFKYPAVFNTSGMGTAGSYGATNYYYPSELLYYGNSPIRVNDNDKRSTDYPLANQWMTDTWTGWDSGTNGFVKSTTRAVAMQNEINYGSALLETKVAYNASVLQDHRHFVVKQFAGTGSAISDEKVDGNYVDEPNQLIPVTDGLFTLTGIIIGGQSQNVGWNYLPYYEVNEDGSIPDDPKMVYGFLYDRAIDPAARTIPATGTSSPNYTIVFDNFEWTAEDVNGFFTPKVPQTPVSIALEFKNNGEDFYGNYNLIRAGGYFYLIGTLDPAAGAGTIDWNRTASGSIKDQHVIPPYKIEDGKVISTETKRVFIQDHKTSVTFKFNTYSLQHAYLTVPDLRSSSLSLGLDVDLNWEEGLSFNDIGLGGDEVN